RHGTLPQLRVFEAVARLGSYTRAAEELHIAQPTVSVQVKKLTATVGLPLLEQVGKRVHMTAAGQELYRTCAELFETLATMERGLSNLRGLTAGSLRIAVTSTGKYIAPRLLAAFVKQHPGLDVSLHVGSWREIVERLTHNADDLYILGNPPGDTEVVVQRILPNPFFVYARADHPLAHQRGIAFDQLAQEPIIVREKGSGTRLLTDRLFAQHGCKPRVIMEVASDEGIKEAILAGAGVSILSRHALGFEPSRQLTMLDVEGFPVESHWHFAYPIGKQTSPIAQAFLEFVRRNAQDIIADAPGTTYVPLHAVPLQQAAAAM
ncbi:MAG TPA: LysR substrate-binding domain-containing protein, partial [Burkholderiales bacterium]|nr:LysR substrate-binding domain-containing protein [Burkholderiales bacterium]